MRQINRHVALAVLAAMLAACTVARSQFVDPGHNAPHPVALRSPFPEVGEELTEPVPFKRLSEEDPFAPAEIDPANIPAVVRWQDAGRYVGHAITVEGRIAHLGKSGAINFLNYDIDWRDKFYLVIDDDVAETLDASVPDTFHNKLLRVTGTVETHRGRPQIRIRSMQQVEFVGE